MDLASVVHSKHMSSTIKNLSKQLLIIPLNSGESIHLAPGETSRPIEDYEMKDNAKSQKLAKRGLMATAAAGAAAGGGKPKKKGA